MTFAKPFKIRKIRTTKPVPLEIDEQSAVVQFCRLKGLMHCAMAQATWTPSWKQINQNKKLGVTKGFPDLCVAINDQQSFNQSYFTLFIELKRVKGGVVSEEQQRWIDHLSYTGAFAKVCKGASEAIAFIDHFLKKN